MEMATCTEGREKKTPWTQENHIVWVSRNFRRQNLLLGIVLPIQKDCQQFLFRDSTPGCYSEANKVAFRYDIMSNAVRKD